MSFDCDASEFPLTDLHDDRAAGGDLERLVRDAHAVELDTALLDHALRLRSARREVRLLEKLHDGDAARRSAHAQLRHLARQLAFSEAALEIFLGALRRCRGVEARDDFFREPRLHLTWMVLLPLRDRARGLERQKLDVAPHELV